jgi:hypothetical protein
MRHGNTSLASTRSPFILTARRAGVAAFASVALAVADAASAQQINQGPITSGPIRPSVSGGSRNVGFGVQPGRGQAMGDGNLMGGQTFSWSRGGGRGEAMGGGNALDANPQLGSGGLNSPGAASDFRSRNLIVTGNVPGGRGFRGSVGYTADTDFRAPVGSDAGYRFRADSAYSNPVFLNSTLSRDRFLLAQGLGDFQYRRDSTPDDPFQPTTGPVQDSQLRLDRANAEMSLSRGNLDRGEDRLITATVTDKGEPIRYIASSLRGLQVQSLTDPLLRSGLGLYELARARQDLAAGIADPSDYLRVRATPGLSMSESDRDLLRLDQKPVTDPPKDLRIDANAGAKPAEKQKSAYDDLLTELGGRGGTGTATDAERRAAGNVELERIRKELDALRRPKKPDAATDAGQKPVEGEVPAGGDGRPVPVPALPGGAPFPSGEDPKAKEKLEEELGKQRSIPELAEILRHRRTIDELSADDRRRVNELIRQGEGALKAGDYFVAERRFEQAQSMAAENPLVESGIAHAQLGAGLYLSSSLTLRNLFSAHPELIDVRYDRALLPAPGRLERAITYLRERAGRGEDAPSYGLVIAYIGHQTGDAKLVEEGLSFVGGNQSLDTNRELLRGVWLGGK